MAETDSLRAKLRALKVLAGPFAPFDVQTASPDPHRQFLVWLEEAIVAGVAEPHAMTLSTVDAEGCPDARVLILKAVDADGWSFATSAASPKGRQIAARASVALTFYWQPLGRQVRLRGPAYPLGLDASAADFRARPEGSRAGTLMNRQSDPLEDAGQLERALAAQRDRMARDPDLIAPSWAVYAVRPNTIEFWQAATDRRHTRLRYRRDGADWTREALWP